MMRSRFLFFIALCSVACLATVSAASSCDSPIVPTPDRDLVIVGLSTKSATAKWAKVTVVIEVDQEKWGLEDVDTNIEKVHINATSKVAHVVDYLRTNTTIAPHIRNLATSSVTLNHYKERSEVPNPSVQPHENVVIRYRAAYTLSFRVAVAHTETALAEIVKRGVSEIKSVEFRASLKVFAKTRLEAITAAVDDGMQQAMSTLAGLGQLDHRKITRDDLRVVMMEPTVSVEGFSNRFEGLRYRYSMLDDSSDVSSSVTPRAQQITARVDMKIKY